MFVAFAGALCLGGEVLLRRGMPATVSANVLVADAPPHSVAAVVRRLSIRKQQAVPRALRKGRVYARMNCKCLLQH